MRRSRKRLLNHNWVVGLWVAASPSLALAGASQGVDLTMTKSLIGAAGSVEQTGGSYSLSSALGEPMGGNILSSADYIHISGYYGGGYGSGQTFRKIASQIGSPGARTFFQDGFQVGVALDAPITIDFSDQLLDSHLPIGIQVFVATDRLGRARNAPAPFQYAYDPAGTRLILTPQPSWQGNTLYDVVFTPDLLSIDRFTLDKETHVQFLTILDPRQENVALHPLAPLAAGNASQGPGSAGVLDVRIPAEALADFSAVLFSRDPLNNPLQVDPAIVREANQKAAAAGGPYRVPIAVQEIVAYNRDGDRVRTMAKPADISMNYEAAQGLARASSPARSRTLSLWVLDETHRLWVKLPAGANAEGAKTVSAPVTRFSVFALMGAPDNSAVDAFVFPVPWRPHGPNAGTGAGQTGTEAGGLTFSNLPSECAIRIYTMAGELVRELKHSDAAGLAAQEPWDGRTASGEAVASGVYLWRVTSPTDGKNGKLMIIR